MRHLARRRVAGLQRRHWGCRCHRRAHPPAITDLEHQRARTPEKCGGADPGRLPGAACRVDAVGVGGTLAGRCESF